MFAELFADLWAEGEALDAIVAELPAADWALPTPARGWTVAHQIAHLAWTDEVAVLAAEQPDAFLAQLQSVADPFTYVDRMAEVGAAAPPAELLARWRAGRVRLVEALRTVPADAKLLWFGPPMKPASMATARLMETWAHGLDVAEAVGAAVEPTARLRHIARLGVRTRDFAYQVRGLTPPAAQFRVELTAPDGELWTFGPDAAAQRVTGPALDFVLLAARRRHRADLALRPEGPDADHWLDIAQCFAGPPGEDPRPRV
ncbi:MAG: TIGR03084 family protein [Mycobacteriaceae bacterium]|nr:TIGR03084 family protein [Mycobacteriaceae bacterium]